MADKIEESFGLATKLIFGKSFLPLEKYSEWLRARIPAGKTVKSALGKGTVYLPDYGFFKSIPNDKAVSFEESERASSKKAIKIGDSSLDSVLPQLKDFAYFVPTFVEGRNIEVANAAVYIDCANVRDSFDPFTTKKSAYNFSVMDSEALFGCYRITKSNFLIHCYNCVKVQRCFEMDSAINCSDSLFCHNVEGLENCMFCFNTKSKKYAIGNLEVGREKYFEVKKAVIDYIVGGLEADGRLGFDIYDVLAAGKSRLKR